MADYVGTTESDSDIARQGDITGRPLIFGIGTPTATSQTGYLYVQVDSSPVSLEIWQYDSATPGWTATGISLLTFPIPSGGTTGQVLAKTTDDAFDLGWTAGGAAVGSTVPDALTPDQTGAAGASSEAARADHAHEILTDAPSTSLTPSTTNTEGSANSFARSDHTHAIASAAPGTISPDDTADAGTAASFAKSDHRHAITTASPSANLTASTTNAEGSANSFARSDHSHAITTGAPTSNLTPSSANTAGSSASLARADHSHAITTGSPSANLTATTSNAEGTAASFARSDHSHAVTTASAGTISGSNATGTSASLARADHDHALGTGVVGTTQLATGAVTAAKIAAQTISAKTGSYTLVTNDAGSLITFDSSSAMDATVNGSLDLSPGQQIDLLQLGTGQVTVVASGATVNGTPSLKLRARYSAATLICVATDTYVLVGDLATS